MSIQNRFNRMALRIQDSTAGLSSRDRKLLGFLVAFAFASIVGGGFYLLSNSVNSVRSQVEYRQETLRTAQMMAAEFQSNQETTAAIRLKLAEHQGANLSAFLEKAAQTVGIADRLDSVKESATSPNGELQEKLYSASLSKLSLEDATNFLYEIETSGFPLVIRNAKFKTRKRNDEREIKLTLDIASYALIDAAGGEG
ncbi:MAG: hypothetical protein VX944_11800 [Myxococcota bacterium]|jgi:type II secretory pathway component PulM|nr:hypothetical protein [Myxococcota bacterium]MEC9390746.1 hypothetical protein [Myxococcota bacterium]